MTIGWRSWLLLALTASLGVQAAVADDPAPAVSVSAALAPWWVHWSHDSDGDRLDDAFGDDVGPFDLFVRYTRVPDASDLARLQRVAGAPDAVYPLAEAVYLRAVPRSTFAALLDLPGVAVLEREKRVLPSLDVASPASLVSFSPELGNGARGRWRVTGRDVVIAVLDTGIDQEHEAFDDLRFLGGYDATIPTGSLPGRLLTVGGLHQATGNLSGDTPLSTVDPDDESTSSHGTHVAGIAFGVDPNGTYMGIAPQVKFLDVKVIGGVVPDRSDLPFGLGSTVLEGLEFVARYNRGESHLGAPGNNTVDIVTLSLGEDSPDPGGDSVLAHAVNRLVDTGPIVVAAAGNCGPTGSCAVNGNNTVVAPGSARQAITVGALTDQGTVLFDDDEVASYSSVGPNGGEPKPNLVAYGTDIKAPVGASASGLRATNNYRDATGTSMAAPMVAGVVALMLEADPSMDAARAKEILMTTTRDIEDPGWDEASGAGALNAYFAVGVALGFLDPAIVVIDETGHEHIEEREIVQKPRNQSRVNLPPDVAFEARPTHPKAGEIVVFIDRSTDPERQRLVAWNWDFGDGDTAKGDRTAHRFDDPGEYVVRLSVTDVNGTAGFARKTLIVEPVPGESRDSPAAPWLVAPVFALALVALARARRRD